MERVINADSKKKGKAEVGHKEHAPPMNVFGGIAKIGVLHHFRLGRPLTSVQPSAERRAVDSTGTS
jgi:hypothetical protein